MVRRLRNAVAVVVTGVGVLCGLAVPALGAPAPPPPTPFAAQLLSVQTPNPAAKNRLTSLGLDVTERAGRGVVDVIAHSPADLDTLRAAGLRWTVTVPDLAARQRRNAAINHNYAATHQVSPLPSGRNQYRMPADYNADMDRLAREHPAIARTLELPERTLEGRPIRGIEIAANVAAEDGRPTFLMLGLHHAREWPSGELSLEFAFDLVQGFGGDRRITELLKRIRVVVVPVVNVDGFIVSRNYGELLDLRAIDGGGTVTTLATPGNAYKRKNCRPLPGAPAAPGACALVASPGGFGIGVDLNRNYAANWGGPGASESPIAQDYRGEAAFSEPETRAVQEFIAARQVTMLITNHTYSNLVLRPYGVRPEVRGPDGLPIGEAPDEAAMKRLGDAMAAQNGYTSQHAYELYDATGSTEDWSYSATGGYGFTFEIGADEFHPPFPQVINEYLGAGPLRGKGNREAFLLAAENAADTAEHSIISGDDVPAGATLELSKEFETATFTGPPVPTRLESSLSVADGGSFRWHVNPSTRPEVAATRAEVLAGPPVRSQSFRDGGTPLGGTEDREFTVAETGLAALRVDLDWPTPDDYDLEVYYREPDGGLTLAGSSGNSLGEKESALVEDPRPGDYVLRVINYVAAGAPWTMEAALFDAAEVRLPGLVEAYTLTCEIGGSVVHEQEVVVDRGQRVKAEACG